MPARKRNASDKRSCRLFAAFSVKVVSMIEPGPRRHSR
jgi:hypothetical protein